MIKEQPREKVEYRENQAAPEGMKDLIGAGDRNRVNLVNLFSFFTVDCDSNATLFLRNAYEGASSRARGWLSEAGSDEGLIVSTFLERVIFSLSWRDWIGCIPKGT